MVRFKCSHQVSLIITETEPM